MEQRKTQGSLRAPLVFLSIYLVFSGVLLALSSGGFVVNFTEVGFTILSTCQSAVHGISSTVTKFFTSVRDLRNLQKEYDLLTEKLKDYEYMRRNNAEIRKELERLREHLGFADSYAYKNISAQIIGRDPNATFSGLTLNKGSVHGVKKGMPVLAIQNGNIGLVGKIVSVGHNTSMVLPVYDYQCNVSGRIEKTRDIGLVSGNGVEDGSLSMRYIRKRRLAELQYGDVVVTSGEGGNYLRDIPIGTITAITVLDYDSSLEIALTPIIEFTRLETVLIVDTRTEREDEK